MPEFECGAVCNYDHSAATISITFQRGKLKESVEWFFVPRVGDHVNLETMSGKAISVEWQSCGTIWPAVYIKLR